jgi:demethylmenaquinone methyltransferase/2-methoxy-6-polyprenyl-1,4-benzoquinol methylase
MNDARSTTPQLEKYYANRASEYERIYDKDERQPELAWLRNRLPELFADRTVLEVACGTGYWTQYIARRAKRIHACDINDPVLDVAREKSFPRKNVTFFKADAFAPDGAGERCDAAFAGFWWSHVRKAELQRFLAGLALRLKPGALVAILENSYVEGSSTPISRTDAEGNTYQTRKLLSGETHEVLKNFPTPAQLADAVRPYASEAHLEDLRYYWLLVFRLK